MEQVKSEKVFFNVFPTLKVGNELQMLFSDVEVKKMPAKDMYMHKITT